MIKSKTVIEIKTPLEIFLATNDQIIFFPILIGAHSQTEVSAWIWPSGNPSIYIYIYSARWSSLHRCRAHMLTRCWHSKAISSVPWSFINLFYRQELQNNIGPDINWKSKSSLAMFNKHPEFLSISIRVTQMLCIELYEGSRYTDL